MLPIDVMKQIAKLSVDVASLFKGEYPDEIIQAFTFTGKYLSISALDKDTRQRVDLVTNPGSCPLCELYAAKCCIGCGLKAQEGTGCGEQYANIRQAIKSGTYIDVAFNMSKVVREMLKKLEETNGNNTSNTVL